MRRLKKNVVMTPNKNVLPTISEIMMVTWSGKRFKSDFFTAPTKYQRSFSKGALLL